MVCQNQSIDDSDAPLARDIRILIRQRIEKGESNNAVRAYLVSRYGDFILLKPRLKLETLLLWLIAPLTLSPASPPLSSPTAAVYPASLGLLGRSRVRSWLGTATPRSAGSSQMP
jgi:hypothetical protein